MGDLRALEGRAGGAATAQNLLTVAQQDLGVGAHIDHQHHAILLVGCLGDQHAHIVRSDVASLQGQHMHIRAGVQLQAHIAGLDVERGVGAQGEGRGPQWRRVEAKHNMVHNSIAH